MGRAGTFHAGDDVPISLTEWSERVGYLPPILDRLALDLVTDDDVGVANAVAEALVTIRDLARAGRTAETNLRLRSDVVQALAETLDEWEFIRATVSGTNISEADEQSILDLLAHDVREAEQKAEAGDLKLAEAQFPSRQEAVAEWVEEMLLSEVESKVYPDLERSPKKNWVEKVGGLPSYIERVAKHLHYERGMPISRAIATAISVTKKMCATGRAFGGQKSVGAKARAVACKAVAQWESKKARSHATKEALVKAVDRFQHFVEPMVAQPVFARRYAHRLSVVEGLLSALADRDPYRAVEAAEGLLSVQTSGTVDERATVLTEMLTGERAVALTLMEALGYAATPKRATEPGHKGKFHGMHGVERAVRRRELIPDGEDEVLFARNGDDKESATEAAAAPWAEGLHPRAPKGRVGGGEFAGKQGGPAAAAETHGGAHGDERAQLEERLTELGYEGAQGLKHFQEVNGLKATGKVDEQTVVALRKADPADQIRKATAVSIEYGKTHSADSAAQQKATGVANDQLQAMGYPNTAAGIAQFQKDYGMPHVTGKLDDKTLATVSTVYGNNARASNAKTADFTGLTGSGVRVSRSAGTRRRSGSRAGSKAKGKGTPAPPGRATLAQKAGKGKVQVTASADDLMFAAERLLGVEEADVAVLGVSRVRVGEPTGENHAQPPGARRQPGGDDLDLDEPPTVPPHLREGVPPAACRSCVHWSRNGMVGSANPGACMLFTYPTDQNDVCDRWETLTPDDASLLFYEAELQEAERDDDADAVVGLRAQVKRLREVVATREPPLHPASRKRAGLSVEEAMWDPSKHPRARGGKFRDVLGKLTSITPGHTMHVEGHQITRGFGKDPEHGEHVYARQFHGKLLNRGSAEEIARIITKARPERGMHVGEVPVGGEPKRAERVAAIKKEQARPSTRYRIAAEEKERAALQRALKKRGQGSQGWHWKEKPTPEEKRAFEKLKNMEPSVRDPGEDASDLFNRGMASPGGRGGSASEHVVAALASAGHGPHEHGTPLSQAALRFKKGTHTKEDLDRAERLAATMRPEAFPEGHPARADVARHKERLIQGIKTLRGGRSADKPKVGDQSGAQAETMRREIKRLGPPMREEILADGSRRFTWRIGTRTIRKVIGRDGKSVREARIREALDTLDLNEAQIEYLTLAEIALEEGAEPDEHLDVFLDVLIEEGTLTAKARKNLKPSDFAIPPDRYPIHDEAHARNALSRVAQHGSPEEQKKVRAAVKRRYPNIGGGE